VQDDDIHEEDLSEVDDNNQDKIIMELKKEILSYQSLLEERNDLMEEMKQKVEVRHFNIFCNIYYSV
jgi:hypothetical protein